MNAEEKKLFRSKLKGAAMPNVYSVLIIISISILSTFIIPYNFLRFFSRRKGIRSKLDSNVTLFEEFGFVALICAVLVIVGSIIWLLITLGKKGILDDLTDGFVVIEDTVIKSIEPVTSKEKQNNQIRNSTQNTHQFIIEKKGYTYKRIQFDANENPAYLDATHLREYFSEKAKFLLRDEVIQL